jgi:hypothetical protein
LSHAFLHELALDIILEYNDRNQSLVYKIIRGDKVDAFAQAQDNFCFMTPLELIEKLHALVPPPRKNLIRHHGVFAANSKNSRQIVKKREVQETPPKKRVNMSWSEMLKLIFNIDASHCEKFGGDVRVIACIRDKEIAREILEHIGEEVFEPKLQSTTPRGPPDWASASIKSKNHIIDENESQAPVGW